MKRHLQDSVIVLISVKVRSQLDIYRCKLQITVNDSTYSGD